MAAQEEDDAQSSLVEDFSYPGADQYTDIELISGNGKIMLTECNGGAGLIRVRSDVSLGEFCFDVTGPGWVKLRLDKVYQIRGDGESDVDATVSVGDVEKDVDVPVNAWAQVGAAAGEGPAVLLELRSA